MTIVLFACVHNAGRSQIAAAFFNALADPEKAKALSAGTKPAEKIHPEVVEVMREVGIDLSRMKPQKFTDELARKGQMLITMGCGESCPLVPGLFRDDWQISDPKGQTLDAVRLIRDEISRRVQALIQRKGWERPRRVRSAY